MSNTFGVDTKAVMSGMRFVRALNSAYGPDRGMEVFDKIREVMGEDVARAIFFAQLSSNVGNDIRITNPGREKIQLIKELRNALGCGLKDAKDYSEGTNRILESYYEKYVDMDKVINILETAADSWGVEFEYI